MRPPSVRWTQRPERGTDRETPPDAPEAASEGRADAIWDTLSDATLDTYPESTQTCRFAVFEERDDGPPTPVAVFQELADAVDWFAVRSERGRCRLGFLELGDVSSDLRVDIPLSFWQRDGRRRPS